MRYLAFILLIFSSSIYAQSDSLIEVKFTRADSGEPVFIRAILSKPEKDTDTALLYFRGYPGVARIKTAADKSKNLQPFMRKNQDLFLDSGIALVVMDCSTDKWPYFDCSEPYRLSKEYADDIRSVMKVLREQHKLSKLFIMGHSMGASSSRGLALNLGSEVSGSIHSAAMNNAHPRSDFGGNFSDFPYSSLKAPQVHVHHQDDDCPSTPYSTVKSYAGKNLMTVVGGLGEGDICGGGHYHSYLGREKEVVEAVIKWIKTGQTTPVVGKNE